MENEENRGLFYKKGYEDHLVPFVSYILDLSNSLSLCLSLLDTYSFLEHFGNGAIKARKQEK